MYKAVVTMTKQILWKGEEVDVKFGMSFTLFRYSVLGCTGLFLYKLLVISEMHIVSLKLTSKFQ